VLFSPFEYVPNSEMYFFSTVDVSLYTYAWNSFLNALMYVTQMAIFKLASKDIYCNNYAG